MTDVVNPSRGRNISSYLTAGSISWGGGTHPGFIIPNEDSPTLVAEDENLNESGLNEFEEESSSDSLDVTIDGGESIVFGAYVARDVETTVTLEQSVSDQVVYLGWDSNNSDEVIIGLEKAFSGTDPKIELYSYDTDSDGVIN